MRSHLTVRNLPPGLARALEKEHKSHGKSLNQTVVDLLSRALGQSSEKAFDNGLGKHAGTWSAAQLAEFEKATRAFGDIDRDLWT